MILLILNFKFKYYSMFFVLPLLAYQWMWLPFILKNHLIYGFPAALTAFKWFSMETTVTHTHLTNLHWVLSIWLHEKNFPCSFNLRSWGHYTSDLECSCITSLLYFTVAGRYWKTCLHFCESLRWGHGQGQGQLRSLCPAFIVKARHFV